MKKLGNNSQKVYLTRVSQELLKITGMLIAKMIVVTQKIKII